MSNRKERKECIFSEATPELRNIVEKYSGVFSFSDNLQLYCNFCRVEIVIPGNKSAHEEVNSHVNGDEHLGLVKAFSEKDIRKKHQSLMDALRDETLAHVSDGLVRCIYCKVILNDSLTNLKNHLVSLDHIFEEFGFGNEADKTLKRKSAKMIYLVAQTADLDFHKVDNTTKVVCKRCEYIVEPNFQAVKYHLDSKKHNSRNPAEFPDDSIEYESSSLKRKNPRSSAGNSPAASASQDKSVKAKRTRAPRSATKKLKYDNHQITATVVSKEEITDEMIALEEDGQQYFVVGEFCINDQQFITGELAEGMDGMERTVLIAQADGEGMVNADGEIVEMVEMVNEIPEGAIGRRSKKEPEEENPGQKALPEPDVE